MYRRLLPILLPLALTLGLVSVGLSTPPSSSAAVELDYAYYKEKVAPILAELCAECHANPRERRKHGRHYLRPIPGRRVRESHHKKNFETISALIEPGNPAASLYLLKPLSARDGGLTHGGGDRLGTNTTQYGTLVDWINGATLPKVVWKPPSTVEGQPSFRFYVERISPVVQSVCAECHQGKGFGKFKVIVPVRGESFTHETRYKNFETILKNVVAGKPERSRFLRKPLPESEGGLRHRGGDKFKRGSEAFNDWVAFISGTVGKPLPTGRPPPIPVLTTAGLTLQAETFGIDADLQEVEQAGAVGTCIAAESGDGDMFVDVNVRDPGRYVLKVRVTPGGPALRWSLNQRPMTYMTEAKAANADKDGFVDVGPRTLSDGQHPLEDIEGEVELNAAGWIKMDAGGKVARWLSPVETDHTGAEAHFTVPAEGEGRDDALLLFDAVDGFNGKVAGLVDGGRKFVVGLLEGGQLRILDSVPARPRLKDPVRRVRVAYYAGLIVGFLDDRPHARAQIKGKLGTGRLGFLTHGVVTVRKTAAREQFDVHTVNPQASPVVDLPRGQQRIWIEIPEGAGVVDSLKLAPTDN